MLAINPVVASGEFVAAGGGLLAENEGAGDDEKSMSWNSEG